MKEYRTFSKVTLVLCVCMIILAVVNYFTGFINQSAEKSGTIIIIAAMITAIVAIVYGEKARKDRDNEV